MRSPWLSSTILQPLFRIFHRRSLRKFLDIHHNIRIWPLAKVSWSHLWTPDRLGVKARQGILFSKERKCVVGSKGVSLDLLFWNLPALLRSATRMCSQKKQRLLLAPWQSPPFGPRWLSSQQCHDWYRTYMIQITIASVNVEPDNINHHLGCIREQSPSDTWSPGPTSPFFASTYRWGRVWTPAKFQEGIFKLHFLWILVEDS